ncbi:MAG: acyl carrier protein [Candidatus Omnitrophota bacterium]
MNFDEIEKQVAKSLENVIGVKKGNIKLEQRLREDLGVDSFSSLELLFELEDSLGIKIPDAEAKKMATVRDVAAYIHNACAAEKR